MIVVTPDIDQRERLDPLTLTILTAAIEGDEVASLALQDRLDELGRTLALEAWRHLQEKGKNPSKHKYFPRHWNGPFGWFLCRNKTREVEDDLIVLKDNDKMRWVTFAFKLEAYEWALIEWQRWKD